MGKLRQRLFTTCATAIVMGGLAGIVPLDAQGGFLGNVTGTSGGPNIFRGGMDIIEVNNPETIVDWRPNDQVGTGAIDFLPNGNVVLYRNNPNAGVADYTVLNRIQPIDGSFQPVSRVIELNGTIQSQINGAPGGSVWFYTPGGFVVGSTGVMDVGSLILTSNPIDTTGGLYGANNTIRFRGVAGSTAGVTIDSGAQITASAANSYIALVAPSVVQGGTVTVNGSTAYVGAEQADIRINGGLFDIAVTVGTTDAHGVQHTGTTTGPASTHNPPGAPDNQRVFMVAVPKNQALTMLLSGDVGYPAASNVFLENSAVVLSAGYDVANGVIDAPSAGAGSGTSGISIGAGIFSSTVDAAATGAIAIESTGVRQFAANGTLTAAEGISLTAGTGAIIEGLGTLSLNAGTGPKGGTVSLNAVNGGSISIAGSLNIDVSGNGNQVVPDAAGGTISLTANGGTISSGALVANATANASSDNSRSGTATGGAITLTSQAAGSLQLGSVSLDAGGNSLFTPFPTVTGGDAQGGTIRLSAIGGNTTFTDVQIRAQATGGTSSTGAAGRATAGDIYVDLSGGTHNWASLFGDVTSAGGYSTSGGTIRGSLPGVNGISLDVYNNASLTLSQSVSLYGDTAIYGYGASNPAAARASNVVARARDGGSIAVTTDFFASAGVLATPVSLGGPGSEYTSAGFGGSISLSAEGGSFSAAGLFLDTDAEGLGGGLVSGNATGGDISVFATNAGGVRGTIGITDCANFQCSLSANGIGSSGANGADGTGGTILLYTSDADLSIPGLLTISTTGRAGGAVNSDSMAGTTGTGFGGQVTIESRFGQQNSGILTLGTLVAGAEGSATPLEEGDFYNQGNGGLGLGGNIALNLFGGQFNATSIDISAMGIGGASDLNCPTCDGGGTTPFQSGPGQGGNASFAMFGGTATIGQLTITAQGSGGDAQSSAGPGTVGAIAGVGTGGTAQFTAQNGTLSIGTLNVNADGTGGSGTSAFESDASDGGGAAGGIVQFLMDSGSSATVTIDALNLSAAGVGGIGGTTQVVDDIVNFRAGTGGGATGGTIDFRLAGGTLNTDAVVLSASGLGGTGGDNEGEGNGGNAGGGIGGTARLTFASEGHAIGSISVNATGTGGSAGGARQIVGFDINDDPIYAYGPGIGGGGGDGTGGTAAFLLDVDPVFTNLTINASGIGSNGGDGGIGGVGGNGSGGTNGAGADLTVTFGTLTVTNQLSVLANGTGGTGGTGFTGRGGDGGTGTGGEAGLTVAGPTTLVQTNLMTVSANGLGGDGGRSGVQGGAGIDGANGGAAFGGAAGVSISDNGTIELGSRSEILADATGGDGATGTASTVPGNGGDGGAGGAATGGRARFVVANGTVRDTADGTLLVSSSAEGGFGAQGRASGGLGGVGGDATGGLAQFESASGDISLFDVAVIASADGGDGADGATGASGGIATGGTATANWFEFVGTLAPSVSPLAPQSVLATLTTDADAFGGDGGTGIADTGGAGGLATGGTAAIGVDGAIAAQFSTIDTRASATGGDGGSSRGVGTNGANGGNALGGRVTFDATGGSDSILPDTLSLIADATGGAGGTGATGPTGGFGGDGGTGTGGDARFTIDGARVRTNNFDAYALSAQGTGGAAGNGGDGSGTGATGGAGGFGGNGTGGLVQFSASNADFVLPGMTLTANGVAGDGGAGGTGPGFPGNPSATPPTQPSGPIQSGGGAGGFATGGIARLLNSDGGTLASGAQRSIDGVSMFATGSFQTANGFAGGVQGGSIVITDSSSAPGGGLTIGGQLYAESYGGNCVCTGIAVSSNRNTILTNSTSLFTNGAATFAFGLNGQLRGTDSIQVIADDSISITQSSLGSLLTPSLFGGFLYLQSFGDITASALARLQATSGIDIRSFGGTINIVRLTAGTNINLYTQNAFIGLDTGIAGDSITIDSGANLIANFLTTSTGDITLTSRDGQTQISNSTAGRDFTITAIDGGVLQSGTARAGRSIAFTGDSVTAGTVIAGDDLTLTARAGLATLQNGTTTGIGATGGSIITVSGTSGAVAFNATAADDIVITGGTDAYISSVATAGRDIRVTATTGTAFLNTLTAGGAIEATANGSVIVGSANGRGAVRLTSITDSVSGGTIAGGSIFISSNLGLTGTSITSGGTTQLVATNGTIDLPDLISAGPVGASAQSISIAGGNTLSFDGVTSTGGPIVLSAGTLTANDLTSASTISLTSTDGFVSASDVGGTDLAIVSAGDASLGGPVTIGGPLSVVSSGTASISGGTVSARTIDIRSRDIVIGTGAQLGVRGVTTGLTLVNTDNQRQTFIGGASLSGSYSLSATEISQMFSDSISVTGNRVAAAQSTAFGSSRAADVSVRDFTVTAGQTGNIASNGTFSILSTGKVRVQGAVRFTGLAPQGGLTINAQEAVEVIAGNGLVDLQGTGNTPGGLLQMTSTDVIVATLAAMDDVSAATTLDARSDRLAQNDGIGVQDGHLRAGAIRLAVSGGAYIQNSGSTDAFADRRGFTAGSIRIDAANVNTQIVLNGQLIDPARGGFVTGRDVIPLLSINGVAGGQFGQYADRSTLNGCLIADPGACDVVTPEVPTPDNRDAIDRILDPTVAVAQIFPVAIVELRDFVAEGYPPLIDEPVTGAGNEDLWDSNCSVAGDEGCETGTAPTP